MYSVEKDEYVLLKGRKYFEEPVGGCFNKNGAGILSMIYLDIAIHPIRFIVEELGGELNLIFLVLYQ